MSSCPVPQPSNVDKDEWRRAVALTAAVEVHDNSPHDVSYKTEQIVKTAARFSRFIRDGI